MWTRQSPPPSHIHSHTHTSLILNQQPSYTHKHSDLLRELTARMEAGELSAAQTAAVMDAGASYWFVPEVRNGQTCMCVCM